jgi:hypothetical protein
MLRKTMTALATAAALTGGLSADAFALASGHAGPFGEFLEHPIRLSDTRSQPATEFHRDMSGKAHLGGSAAGGRMGRIGGYQFVGGLHHRYVSPGDRS